jgi:CpeT/CpcT family protein DUF1001
MELKRAAARVLAVAACLAAGGCASELRKAEVDVAQIADLLPGQYNNRAQAGADAKAGNPRHDAKSIAIVRVSMPLLSSYAFYAQENSLDEMGEILSQRLYTFEAVKDGSVVQRIYTFSQPARWRDGQNNPSIFTGVMFKDTSPMAGCDLVWKKEGKKFVAANSREACRMSSPTLGTMRTEMKVELDGDELAMAELGYSPGGKLVQGIESDPFFRFERGGQ